MATEPSATNPSSDSPSPEGVIDAAAKAAEASLELLAGMLDDAGQIWHRSLIMWRRPLEAAAQRPVAPGFHSYGDGKTIEELSVGDTASLTRTITQSDIDTFARISGDDNPAHVDREWAEKSILQGRVAHGILTAGIISAVLGTELPGPGALYMGQTLKWTAPVRPGDVVTGTVTVKEIVLEKKRVVLDTVATVGDTTVLVGEATVRPRAAS